MANSRFFAPAADDTALCVLTIAATFPSLIQPWLVNNLVQIGKNGGENRVLAARSELDVYSEAIDTHGLLDVYGIVPTSNLSLLGTAFANLLAPSALARTPLGIKRWLASLAARQLAAREKALGALVLPYLGLRSVDVIHSHSEPVGFRLRPIIRALNVPMVVTFHGLPPKGVRKLTERERQRYLDFADAVLVNTEFAKRHYVSLGAPEDKIRILPQGTNLSEYPFDPPAYPSDRPLRLLTVGRWSRDKGQRFALDALAALAKEGMEIRYTLVGSGPDAGELRDRVKELGIESLVEFHSNISSQALRDIYAASDVFLLPSVRSRDGFHEETQGVVLQEAQATGLLTIATRTGGIPECIDDGKAGFLIEDRSAAAIAEALRAIHTKPERWPTWQRDARQWVEDRYDTDVIGRRVFDVYEELVASRKPR